jgi:group I intron endonuclease
MYIYRSLLKHGYSNFGLEILEYCSSGKLIEKEKYYIKLLNPEYNIIQDPTLPPMSNREHSEETRKKLTVPHAGHFKKGGNRLEGAGRPSLGTVKS